MRKIFMVNNATPTTDLGLLIARIGLAALMLTHGIPKLQKLFSGEPIQFISVMGLGATASLALAVLAEVICSLFLLAGFATRLSTIPLIITMLVAVFRFHIADPFKAQEPALLYLTGYLVLLFTGSGRYSLDYLITRGLQTKPTRN